MRELSPQRQRLLVLAALVLLAVVVAVVPLTRDGGRADAAVSCGGNRASLVTDWGTTVTPCLSKVPTHLVVTRNGTETRFKTVGFRRMDTATAKFADGTTLTLRRLRLKSMAIYNSATLLTVGGAGNVAMTPDTVTTFGDGSTYVNIWVLDSDTVNISIPVFASCNTTHEIGGALLGLGASFGIADVDGCGADLHIYYMAVDPSSTATTVSLPNTTVQVNQ